MSPLPNSYLEKTLTQDLFSSDSADTIKSLLSEKMNDDDQLENPHQSPIAAIDFRLSGDRGSLSKIPDHNNDKAICEICGQRTRLKDLDTHHRRTRCADLRLKHDVICAVRLTERAAHQHQQQLDHQHDKLGQQFYRASLTRTRRTNTLVGRQSQLSDALYCKNCKKPFKAVHNNSDSCRWHLGPMVDLFGGTCSSCGRLDYQNGCMVGKHESKQKF